MDYFKLREVQLITENGSIGQQILAHSSEISLVDTSQKMIFLDLLNDTSLDKYLVNNEEIINDTLVFIPNVHRNRERHAFWKKIKDLEKVTVSMDMFYGGLIFFRKEQAKEHFKIRI